MVLFYLVLVPLGVGGTTTAVGRFPRSFFVLEGLLTLAGMGGVRFLIRASSEWQGWRPGDPDRRRAEPRPATELGPVPTLVYGAGDIGATVLRTIGVGARRPRDARGRVLDDDRGKRNQVLRGQQGPRRDRRARGDRPRHRRAAPAHRHPDGVGRRRPPSRRRRDPARAGDPHRARRSTSSSPAGSAPPRSARSRSPTCCAATPVVIDETGLRDLVGGHAGPRHRAPAAPSAPSSPARCSTWTPTGSSCSTAPKGPLYDIERELSLLGERDSGTAARGGRPRATLVTRLANVARPGSDSGASSPRTGP